MSVRSFLQTRLTKLRHIVSNIRRWPWMSSCCVIFRLYSDLNLVVECSCIRLIARMYPDYNSFRWCPSCIPVVSTCLLCCIPVFVCCIPLVFLLYSCCITVVFLFCFCGFPVAFFSVVFLWLSCCIHLVVMYSCGSLVVFLMYPYGCSVVFLWLSQTNSCCIPVMFRLYTNEFPLVSLWLFCCIHVVVGCVCGCRIVNFFRPTLSLLYLCDI